MKKIAVIFPGQGSQYVGMAKEITQNHQKAKATFEEASDIVGYDVLKMCLDADLDTLSQPENNHVAIYTLSVAMFESYYSMMPAPNFLAGHSLGEYSALTCGGFMNFADGVKIVRKRGLLMKEASSETTGTIAISGLEKGYIETLCAQQNKDEAVVACFNSISQFVVSGTKEATSNVADLCESKGANVTPLNIKVPVHTPLMRSAEEKLQKELSNYNYGPLHYRIISNVTAREYSNEDEVLGSLVDQMTNPVQWFQSIKNLLDQNVHYFLEMGPKKGLSRLLNSYSETFESYAFDDSSQINDFKESLKSNIHHYNSFLAKCLVLAVGTRNYNENDEEYQNGVVVPYRQIKELDNLALEEKRVPTTDEQKKAFDCLNTILTTKMMADSKRDESLKKLLLDTGTSVTLSEYI